MKKNGLKDYTAAVLEDDDDDLDGVGFFYFLCLDLLSFWGCVCIALVGVYWNSGCNNECLTWLPVPELSLSHVCI